MLILDDEVDEIVFSGIDKYGDIELKAINKAATSEDLKDEAEPDKGEELKPLLDKIKATLGRPCEGCAGLSAARRQPVLHRFRRRRAFDEDAADAACHGSEGPTGA